MHTTLRLFLAFLLLGSVATAQARPGSIYDPSRGSQSMLADKTARRPGDLITVLIVENQNVNNEESANLKKETTLDYSLDSFDIAPEAFNPLPNIGASSKDDFIGTANYKKRGTFSALITAIVMDRLPNGNLVISGRREIKIDNEIKTIDFSGVIRRYDIKPDNTIESELVAEARVSYTGEGPLTNGTNRRGLGGMIHSAISWLWPF